MRLPPAYQLALDMYELASDTAAVRREIWTVLSPLMSGIINQHRESTKLFAPFYRDLLEKKNAEIAELVSKFTERLFTRPFDEAWVTDTKERAKAERELGFDMRMRTVIAHLILSNLNRALAQMRWTARRRCPELLDFATRVLIMDAANAAIVHFHIEARKAEAKNNQLDNAIVSFGKTIESLRQTIDSAINAIDSTSQQLTHLSGRAVDQVNQGVTSANRAAMNVSQMAAATGDMNTSIVEIRRQASLAHARAEEAMSDANRMNEEVSLLSEAVGKIGSVANLIAGIAEQTNLLALNAAIEAARAGHQGRGFAVVAAEVKMLASQTADATKHIGDEIALIEQMTRKSVNEIGATTSKIREIASVSKLVENSVTQQAHTSIGIADDASKAASHTVEAAASLKSLVDVVASTRDNAGVVLNLARQLLANMRQVDEAMGHLLRASQDDGLRSLANLTRSVAWQQENRPAVSAG
jgi:methyl-accepting chemotaxis protein